MLFWNGAVGKKYDGEKDERNLVFGGDAYRKSDGYNL